MLAISNNCILTTDDEQSTYQRYFSILDHYENELHTASSQTCADRALAFRVGTENCAGDQSAQEVRVTAEKRPQPGQGISTGSAKHARQRTKHSGAHVGAGKDPQHTTNDEEQDDSASATESSDESTLSSSSGTSDGAVHPKYCNK